LLDSIYLLCLRAGFPSLTGTATVTVLVADINDNAPQFHHAGYDARVAENRPAGEVVARPTATDLDTARNADVRFAGLLTLPALHAEQRL